MQEIFQNGDFQFSQLAPPPPLPLVLDDLPCPQVRGCFQFFFPLKMTGKDI